MKQFKVAIIATIITAVLIVSCANAMAEARPEFYPKLVVVTDCQLVGGELWLVNSCDSTGNIWSFYDDKGEWCPGDIANLLMMTNNEFEEDDEIVEVYWEGYTESINQFFFMIGW